MAKKGPLTRSFVVGEKATPEEVREVLLAFIRTHGSPVPGTRLELREVVEEGVFHFQIVAVPSLPQRSSPTNLLERWL